MSKYFSASACAFFVKEIHGENMPADVVEISDAEHESLLMGQSSGKVLSTDGAGRPVLLDPPVPSADVVRDQVWEAIKAERDRRATQGGYPVVVGLQTKWFHSDAGSKIQQLALARKADLVAASGGDMEAQFSGNAGLWKTMDGSFVPMTANLAHAIVASAEQQEGAMFAVAEQHKAALYASSDPAAYDFSGGWPKIFGEPDPV